MSSQLDSWLEAEAAQQARLRAGPGQGVMPHDAVAGKTGLEFMQSLLNAEHPYPAIGVTMDFLLLEVAFGRAVFQGTPGPKFTNPMGTMHGGWYAALLDSALGCCIHTALPQGRAYTTLELKVNIIRAVGPQVQRVRAEGQVIHVGGQTATADARLVGPDGKLYAHASTTCLVFDLRPPARA